MKVNTSELSGLAALGPLEVATIARVFPFPEVDELVRVLTSFTGSIRPLP
ncbi:hypothetical protein [Nocardioides sp. CER19]|nr:hypothetical protein [Nocardioides sp. CER19]MDH2414380.1 hypothetical protein [Nocardioides sp. CER19]